MVKLSHLDSRGNARMVDVSEKPVTQREAVASGAVFMRPKTLRLIQDRGIPKGDVLCVARVAGIMAAKKTSEIIPLCHALNVSSVSVDFAFDNKKSSITIESRATFTGKTGVEMEVLTAVAAAALAIYDMCKSVDKGMVISDILLREKSGGRSGQFRRGNAGRSTGRSPVPLGSTKKR